MAQGFLISSPRMRFWDANGEILALGKVYFYEAGTDTPQNTWSNSDLTSLNTNPVILSASGECTVFVPQGDLYKVDLFDADDVHQAGYPIDGVEAIPAPDPPAPTPDPVPTGAILAYGGTAAPSGFLLCTGALVSRSTYSALFTAIGTAFGAGDGSTTFGLPDLQQRFPLGKAASGTGSTLGGTGGAIDHTHTGPSHTHDVHMVVGSHTHTVTAAAHTHGVTVPRAGWGDNVNTPSVAGQLVVGNGATAYSQPTGDKTVTSAADGALAAVATSLGGTIDQTVISAAGGTGITGTSNPSFQAVNWIIKT